MSSPDTTFEMLSLSSAGLLVDMAQKIITSKGFNRLSGEELALFDRLYKFVDNAVQGIDGINTLTIFPNMQESLDILKIIRDALNSAGGPNEFAQIAIYLASIKETIAGILLKGYLDQKDVDVLEPFLQMISEHTTSQHKVLLQALA